MKVNALGVLVGKGKSRSSAAPRMTSKDKQQQWQGRYIFVPASPARRPSAERKGRVEAFYARAEALAYFKAKTRAKGRDLHSHTFRDETAACMGHPVFGDGYGKNYKDRNRCDGRDKCGSG